MKNELTPPIMESILNKRFKTKPKLSGVCEAKKKNRLVWSCNPQLPLSSTLVPSAGKPQRNEIFKPIHKKC